jgi:L-ascorbate metabolism protein UlaG (beta-lactamase superfamily)
MIKPILQDDSFLHDVRRASHEERVTHLWWLGQSGFLVKFGSRYLLLDPYLSDSLTKKYASTDKPHVRMTERVVAPERLDFVDVMTSSHNHTDHLDAETLVPLMKANPAMRVVVAEANRTFAAERLGVDPATLLGIDAGKTMTVAGFDITAVPAAHERIATDEQGQHKFLGHVVRTAGCTIYHSGDTVPYEGMIQALRRHDVDVALLPINGRKPERRVDGNLWGREAAWLAKEIGAKVVIPCHYEMFEFNTETPEQFVDACETLRQPYRVLRCGERFSSTELRAGV